MCAKMNYPLVKERFEAISLGLSKHTKRWLNVAHL
jgi:hypothetical protein